MKHITNSPPDFNQNIRQELVLAVKRSEANTLSALEALTRFDCDWSRRKVALRDAREAGKRRAYLNKYLPTKTAPPHRTKAGSRLARHCGIPVHLAESFAPLAGMKAEG